MAIHNDRAQKRAEHEAPINFTCGVCGKVHPYNEGYICPDQEAEVEGE